MQAIAKTSDSSDGVLKLPTNGPYWCGNNIGTQFRMRDGLPAPFAVWPLLCTTPTYHLGEMVVNKVTNDKVDGIMSLT